MQVGKRTFRWYRYRSNLWNVEANSVCVIYANALNLCKHLTIFARFPLFLQSWKWGALAPGEQQNWKEPGYAVPHTAQFVVKVRQMRGGGAKHIEKIMWVLLMSTHCYHVAELLPKSSNVSVGKKWGRRKNWWQNFGRILRKWQYKFIHQNCCPFQIFSLNMTNQEDASLTIGNVRLLWTRPNRKCYSIIPSVSLIILELNTRRIIDGDPL